MRCGRIWPSLASVFRRGAGRGVKELLLIIAGGEDERLPVDAHASLVVLAAEFTAMQTMIGIDRETDHGATSLERGEPAAGDDPWNSGLSGRPRDRRDRPGSDGFSIGS